MTDVIKIEAPLTTEFQTLAKWAWIIHAQKYGDYHHKTQEALRLYKMALAATITVNIDLPPNTQE